MNRLWLAGSIVLVLGGVILFGMRTRSSDEVGTSRDNTPASVIRDPGSGPSVVVKVDGAEVSSDTVSSVYGSRLSDLRPELLEPSLISSVRASGQTQVLVLVDGSEVYVNQSIQDRLPAAVQYRLGYDRSAGQ